MFSWPFLLWSFCRSNIMGSKLIFMTSFLLLMLKRAYLLHCYLSEFHWKCHSLYFYPLPIKSKDLWMSLFSPPSANELKDIYIKSENEPMNWCRPASCTWNSMISSNFSLIPRCRLRFLDYWYQDADWSLLKSWIGMLSV